MATLVWKTGDLELKLINRGTLCTLTVNHKIDVLQPERMELKRDGVTVYSYNTYFQHISSSIVVHWVHPRNFLLPPWIELLPPWFKHFLSVQDYKRKFDIINIYKLYKIKAQESSSHCYSLREMVGLDGKVIAGSDLKTLQYVFKDLVNV